MKKVILITLAVLLVVIAAGFVFIMNSGPDLKNYEYLRQPQIKTVSNQKMLVAELSGDPNKSAGKAIGQLYGTFYQLKNNHIKQAAPRARWPVSLETKRTQWVGIYGLPVSETVTSLPSQKSKEPLKLTTWEYGTVAEILHIGPYSTEKPDIDRLKQFITDNGYRIIGDHEEEYLKGPGLWPTDPQKYYTIIRYRIEK